MAVNRAETFRTKGARISGNAFTLARTSWHVTGRAGARRRSQLLLVQIICYIVLCRDHYLQCPHLHATRHRFVHQSSVRIHEPSTNHVSTCLGASVLSFESTTALSAAGHGRYSHCQFHLSHRARLVFWPTGDYSSARRRDSLPPRINSDVLHSDLARYSVQS